MHKHFSLVIEAASSRVQLCDLTPLRQNYKHVRALESLLGLSRGTGHSVAVFAAAATLKTAMPDNVTYALGSPGM